MAALGRPVVPLVKYRPAVGYRSLAQVNPTWPQMGQRFAGGFAFAVAVSSSADEQVRIVRNVVTRAAPDQPLEHVGLLQAYFNNAGLAERSRAAVFAVACAFGLLLSMLGVVGLVSDAVVRRIGRVEDGKCRPASDGGIDFRRRPTG